MIREITQRKFDNKWIEWSLVDDPFIDKKEWDENHKANPDSYFPKKYICTGVYDYMISLEKPNAVH